MRPAEGLLCSSFFLLPLGHTLFNISNLLAREFCLGACKVTSSTLCLAISLSLFGMSGLAGNDPFIKVDILSHLDCVKD